MRTIYALFGVLVIAAYSFVAVNGYELSSAKRKFSPKSVRGQSGGGRAVYYGGYRGGK